MSDVATLSPAADELVDEPAPGQAPLELSPLDRIKAAVSALSQTHGPDRLYALELVVRELVAQRESDLAKETAK